MLDVNLPLSFASYVYCGTTYTSKVPTRPHKATSLEASVGRVLLDGNSPFSFALTATERVGEFHHPQ